MAKGNAFGLLFWAFTGLSRKFLMYAWSFGQPIKNVPFLTLCIWQMFGWLMQDYDLQVLNVVQNTQLPVVWYFHHYIQILIHDWQSVTTSSLWSMGHTSMSHSSAWILSAMLLDLNTLRWGTEILRSRLWWPDSAGKAMMFLQFCKLPKTPWESGDEGTESLVI